MDGRRWLSSPLLRLLAIAAVGLTVFPSCEDPFGFEPSSADPEPEEICPSSEEWLPNTPPLEMFNPLPHPATECPFYRGAWQNFLIATQPDASGRLALQGFPTIENLFQPARPFGNNRAWLGGIKQAGGRQILVDQNGRSLYYGIHTNRAFADFVNRNGLKTKENILAADPNLFFPAGVVTFKSAWQETVAADTSNADYITTRAMVATIRRLPSGELREDRNTPRETLLRLLALHVVFTLPGHPEFIWGTFEHSAGTPDTRAEDGKRNVAPNMHRNPFLDDPNNQRDGTVVCPDSSHLLCRQGTTANQGNQPIPEAQLAQAFDERSQIFTGQQTSIYRMFPASKSNTIEPDPALTSLNHNVEKLFEKALADGRVAPFDKRGRYRMVGAQWMDKPAYLKIDFAIQDDDKSPFAGIPGFAESIAADGSDSDLSILAGENRLSSTAMESFTQAPDSFSNCFSCHNTQAITAKGIPLNRDTGGTMIMPPKLINVSHIFSEFLIWEQQAAQTGMPQ
jgi:hypothetical protein